MGIIVADDEYIDSSILDRLLKHINYKCNDLDDHPRRIPSTFFMPHPGFLAYRAITTHKDRSISYHLIIDRRTSLVGN